MIARVTRAIVVPLLLAGALGALAGWLWWLWWSPAPKGQVYETPDGPQWFPNPFDPGIARDFGGTATYVVLAVALGIVLGAVAALLARDTAVVGLAAVMAASVLAAVVMTLVGVAQSPADPDDRAADVAIGTKLPGHLHVTQGEITLPKGFADLIGRDDRVVDVPTPHLAWPLGASLGYLGVMLVMLNGRPQRPAPLSAAPAQQG